MTTTYEVTAKRWDRGWELHIDGVGVTQSRTLLSAEDVVREYIALELDLDDSDGFDVRITPDLADDLAVEAGAARRAVRDAESAQRAAGVRSRDVARRLRAAGLSGADVAAVLGVSTQRVSQLVND